MKARRIGIVLIILDVALVGTLGYFYVQKDRNVPRIYIEETGLVYQEGMAEAELLAGVTAIDPEDGDVTYSLVIEKIVTDPDKGIAVITYGARDLSGNLAKASASMQMLVEGEHDSEDTSAEE